MLDGVSLLGLNTALGLTYAVLIAWGIFAFVMSLVDPDEVAWQVNIVSYIAVGTISHYGISLGAGEAVKGAVSYPVSPALYRALDVVALVAASTLVVFFLDTSSLFAAPQAGSLVTTGVMAAQLYKVGSIVQGISSGVRDEASGKLLSELQD